MILPRSIGRSVRLAAPAFAFSTVLLLPPVVSVASGQAPATEEAVSAKTWVGKEAELEEFLKSVEVVSCKDVGVGVTKPQRCTLAPGGPFAELAFKGIQPGRHGGYWESYRSEIAAYELDKAFGLGMVPVTVEKRVKDKTGAAVMWVSPTKSFKDMGGPPSPPGQHLGRWNLQLVRAKMFDNLIGNLDPNLGNWLADPAWNLILIDHTRAFTTDKKLYHELKRIDPALWAKMQELTQESLEATIGKWVGKSEIKAVLERRDKMAEVIKKLGNAPSEE